MDTITETTAFRPWNTDSMATVVDQTPATVTISYDHAPQVRHTIKRLELARIGRFVNREDF